MCKTTKDFFVPLLSVLLFTCASATAQDDEDELLADFSNSFDFQTLGGSVGRMEPHGNDLMGDMIDKNTGALTFKHTDVSIPGNSGLEVALHRKLTQGYKRESPYQQAFNDWALDIPIAYFSYGYDGPNSADVGPVFDGGCMIQEPARTEIYRSSPIGGATSITYDDHFSGVTLSVPSADLSGFQGWWIRGLQDPVANWVSGGQGADFNGNCAEIAIAPDGTQYKFGRHTFREGKTMELPARFNPHRNGVTQNGRTGQYGYVWLWIPKTYAVYLITEVVDVNGNYVRYEYNDNDDLTRIHANDGREITLEYNSPSSSIWGFNLVSTVAANSREWDYIYTPQDTVFGARLDKVVLPDGRSWGFDTSMMSAAEYKHWNCVPRDFEPIQITHPDGAVGRFKTRETRHIKNARRDDVLGDEDWIFKAKNVGPPIETTSSPCNTGHLNSQS